jgi:hypothetical protein
VELLAMGHSLAGGADTDRRELLPRMGDCESLELLAMGDRLAGGADTDRRELLPPMGDGESSADTDRTLLFSLGEDLNGCGNKNNIEELELALCVQDDWYAEEVDSSKKV